MDDQTIWVPAGSHVIEPAQRPAGLRLIRFNGDLKAARVVDNRTIEFSYHNSTRGIAMFDRPVSRIQIDGVDQPIVSFTPATVLLPWGQHIITAFSE